MFRDGFSKLAISKILQVNRNTVHTHLTGRVAYHDELARAIGMRDRPLCDDDPMPIYLASEYLPGSPRPVSTFLLYQSGILRAKIERRGKYQTRMLVASHRDIRRAARSILPPGLWIRSSRLQDLIDDDLFFDRIFSNEKVKDFRAMSRRYFLWIDVVRECLKFGAVPQPDPKEISRAIKTLDLTGVGWF